MDDTLYRLADASDIPSPQLIYYPEIIRQNTEKTVALAGGAHRLWPHVKTHKSADVLRMQVEMGIVRFKCATFAEAEMAAAAAREALLVAYPLVGPNVARFVRLVGACPQVECFALADDLSQLRLLGACAADQGRTVNVLLDVNMGMNRTGVTPAQAEGWYQEASALPGIRMRGMHCYDGHRHETDTAAREEAVAASLAEIDALRARLSADGLDCGILIMGGTPSFPCHAARPGVFLSPGTCFVMDYGYARDFPDLPFVPGAALLTRVVSHPAPGLFTLDLGCKGICSDPAGLRGLLLGWPDAKPLFQSEEHWVFQMDADAARTPPPIGAELYVLPTHICPTTALYPSVLTAQDGRVIGEWNVTARNRKTTI